jgi:glycine cleavage system aminomethyltransferase T
MNKPIAQEILAARIETGIVDRFAMMNLLVEVFDAQRQLQARLINMFKEHWSGNTQR